MWILQYLQFEKCEVLAYRCSTVSLNKTFIIVVICNTEIKLTEPAR